jgi:hypothetical protein
MTKLTPISGNYRPMERNKIQNLLPLEHGRVQKTISRYCPFKFTISMLFMAFFSLFLGWWRLANAPTVTRLAVPSAALAAAAVEDILFVAAT